MNLEEILIRMGIDQAGVDRGLKSVGQKVEHFAEAMVDSVKDIVRNFGATIGIAGIVELFNRASEKAIQISRTAQTLKVSTGFVQDIQNVARSSGIAAEEVESMLNKFAKQLAEGSNVEESFYRVAEAIRAIEDPAQRVRLEMDLFGKTGVKLNDTLVKGEEGIKEFASNFYKFSDQNIEDLKNSREEIEKWSNSVEVSVGKALSTIRDGIQFAKELRNDKTKDTGSPLTFPFRLPGLLKEHFEGALWRSFVIGSPDNLKKGIDKAVSDMIGNPTDPNALLQSDANVKAERESGEKSSEASIQNATTMIRKLMAIRDQRKMLQSELVDALKERRQRMTLGLMDDHRVEDLHIKLDQNTKSRVETERALLQAKKDVKKIDEETLVINEKQRQLMEAQYDKFKPTIRELLTTGVWYTNPRRRGPGSTVFGPNPFMREARAIEYLEEFSKYEFISGNPGRARAAVDERNRRYDQLAGLGIVPQRDEKSKESMIEMNDRLKELLDGKHKILVEIDNAD